MKANEVFSEHFCKSYDLYNNKEYIIEYVNPIDLIVSERLDLIAKLKYIESFDKGYNSDFAKSVYIEHIEIFSLGKFKEPGNNKKNSIEKYLETFEYLISDIKRNGFDISKSVVPVGSNNIILDGAHRTAIAIYYGIRLPIIRIQGKKVNYDANFFTNRLMSRNIVDYLVQEYIKLKDDIFIGCIWPVGYDIANKHKLFDNINTIFNSYSGIIYKKSLHLNYNGLKNLIIETYGHQDWIGNVASNFSGADSKATKCYSNSEMVSFFVLEGGSLKDILVIKEEIRELFNNGKHSLHITDNKKESVELSDILLNENSIHLLNNGAPYMDEDMNRNLRSFKSKIIKSDANLNDFIIDSSSIMSLYNIRKTDDLDYLSISDKATDFLSDEFDNHYKYSLYYNKTIDELILNPTNYLVHNKLKFITLENLIAFKKARNEIKDVEDLRLIVHVFDKTNKYKLYLIKKHMLIKKRLKHFYQRIKITISIVLKLLGLYGYVIKIKNRL